MEFLFELEARQVARAARDAAAKREACEEEVCKKRRGAHCRHVYALLQEVVRPEWHSIAEPDSEEWLKQFNTKVSQRESLNPHTDTTPNPSRVSSPNKLPTEATSTPNKEDGSAAFSELSSLEEFLLLNKVSTRIDTPWVLALRRLRAIAECEASRPLELTEVLKYAKRIAGSVAAPPETSNLTDVVAHQSAFPSYHFLPYPSMEEIQNSRLAALAAKPYGEVCFPPELTSKVVYLRKEAVFAVTDTPTGPTPCFNTSLVSDEVWRSTDGREVFYELRFTCPTPCCSFWFAAAEGLLPASHQLPAHSPMQQLHSLKPLLVPGPFPKTVRVQCRKAGKKDSRITQAFLKLKGKAAATATSAALQPHTSQRTAASTTERPEGGLNTTTEAAGTSQGATAAAAPTAAEARPSQFHGLMLGASRKRGQQQRRQKSSSESSSGSSSDGD